MSTAKQDPVQAERAARRAAWAGKLQGHLSKFGSPRTQLALMVAFTGAAGLVASFGLLELGLRVLWLRYSLAVLLAYLVFLCQVWIWLALEKRRLLREGLFVPESDAPAGPAHPSVAPPAGKSGNSPKDKSGVEDVLAAITDAGCGGELGLIFLALAAIVLVLLGLVLLIATAPALLAEVLLDGLLSASLYRRLKGLDPGSWLETAVRKTWMPFLVAFLIFLGAGLVLHTLDPHAVSIVDFWKHLRQGHR
jgi:hypothetical protein